MSQQIIDFGSFPNDPSADPIRAAFQKVQNNFTELYATSLSTGVLEISAGSGISQNRTTGNVTLTANISNIRLSTGSTNSLVFGTTSTPTAGTITAVSSIAPIYIDLAPNITTVNANFTGNVRTSGNFVSSNISATGTIISAGNLTSGNISSLGSITSTGNLISGNITTTGNINTNNISITNNLTVANFAVSGLVTTSLIPSVNETYDLGNSTRRWKDLYLSGNTLQLGTVPVRSDGTSILMPNVAVTGNIAAGNITAGTVSGNLTTAVQPNITSVGTLAQLEVAGAFSAGTITGNYVLPAGGNIQAPGSNMQVLFNDSGNQSAVAGLLFDKANTLLTVQGDISGSNLSIGNATITGNIGVNKVVATGNVEGSNIVTLGVVSTRTGITTGASLDITSISGNGTFVTVNFATQSSVVFATGSAVTITGVSPSSYNGTWTVDTGTTSSITFASSLTTAATVTSARIKGSGNTTINGALEVVGNTSIGNITAVNSITGNTITLSGNVDSGNLIASGIIRVTGTANLGAVFSPGDSNVQNSTVRGSFGASGAATFAGTITANADASFYANVLANSNMSVTGTLTAGTANIANFVIASSGSVTGNVFTATLFSGNGANISFINASNIVGVVSTAASATTSNTANIANNVILGSYSNITGVGTLTSITTSGTFNGKNANFDGNLTVSNGFVQFSHDTAILANGASQLSATALVKTVNIVISVANGTGVMLPTSRPGVVIYIINDTSTNIRVYPSSGEYIDRQAVNTSFTIGSYGRMSFVGGTSPYWFTMTAIYA